MKKTTSGIALIILGVMMFIYTGINFITTKKVIEVGSVDIRRQENHPIQWSPIVGAVIVVSGLVLVRSASVRK